jgi:hypothetical protein
MIPVTLSLSLSLSLSFFLSLSLSLSLSFSSLYKVISASKTVDSIFKEARDTDAVLVFDECECLFGIRSQSSTTSADMGAAVLYHIRKFSGIVFLVTK